MSPFSRKITSLGVGEERRRVGGEELLALAEAENERRSLADGDDLRPRRPSVADDRAGVHPLELADRARTAAQRRRDRRRE